MIINNLPSPLALHKGIGDSLDLNDCFLYTDEELVPSSLVSIMLRSAEVWNRVSAFASKVVKEKMDVEWRTKMQSRAMASSTPMYHPNDEEKRSSEGEDDP